MKELKSEILRPNYLSKEEIKKLDGWKLKVCSVHFGNGRGDCVRLDYGYALIEEIDDNWNRVKVPALVSTRGERHSPISLKGESALDNIESALLEFVNPVDFLRDKIAENVEEWFSDGESFNTNINKEAVTT